MMLSRQPQIPAAATADSSGLPSHPTFRYSQSAFRLVTDNGKRITGNASKISGFTLMELIVVVGIIAILMVMVVPAFTNLKSAGDVTAAAYTIKSVLDTARTYAKANNTYAWVGFFEEDISSATPGTAGPGRLVMSIVASKDGSNLGADSSSNATGTNNWIDVTQLTQVG